MTPEQFIATWKSNPLTERAGAQPHFDDLCELLGVDKPRDPENYCFERGAKKSTGGDGWADVWKRNHFGWENKKPGRDLNAALKQLTDYALQLENPPLLVVCDRERIVIHTAFTGYPDEAREIRIAQLLEPEARQILKWVFTDPEKLRPEKSTAAITAQAAGQFAQLAAAMRNRGQDGQNVAHFLVQCLFCMFAEDEALLPAGIFTDLLKNAGVDADKAARRIEKLFTAMQKNGGEYGDHDIAWFNGGLFKNIEIPPLSITDLQALHRAAADMDWRAIDPTIFGTLFERGLDPSARAPLGAHYTDTGTIAKLIEPLVSEPLAVEWAATRAEMVAKPKKAKAAYQTFLLRLNHYRVLDPACGSGNFLYLALKALRDIEKQVLIEVLELGQPAELSMQTGPHNILGLEINEFAAELARVTVWIGDIQWCRRNGYPHAINPILKPLDGIEHRDALLTFSPIPLMKPLSERLSRQKTAAKSLLIPASPLKGEEPASLPPLQGKGRGGDGLKVIEATWPIADVIVGNPPFLGGSKKGGELGRDYFDALNHVYDKYVPGGADLVCYWFHKARQQIVAGQLQAAGFVSTQAIRAGSNRKVLEAIVADTHIFEAWSDEKWVNEGADVRVSLVAFGSLPSPASGGGAGGEGPSAKLDGQPVTAIHADLTAGEGLNLTQACLLTENRNVGYEGTKKYGDFDIPGEIARSWLCAPNPNGLPNSVVIKPWANGQDIAKRPSDTWIIDFGADMSEAEASLFELAFQHVLKHVKLQRKDNKWWLHERPRPEMRKALIGLKRFIVTPRVAKHRYFVWQDASRLPDTRLCVIARADDVTFGILSSRVHVTWAMANASMHGVGNDPTYNNQSCFQTFPFPAGLTPRDTVLLPLQGGGWEGDGSIGKAPATTHPHPNPDEAPKRTTKPPKDGGQVAAYPLEGEGVKTAIAAAARRLNELREAWLNPAEWVDWVITPEEEKAGFPKRPVAKPGCEADLKKRTLTNLYNARPAWLDLAHKQLDQAVAAAYGWTDYSAEMPDNEILRRLLALNLERARYGAA